MNVYPFVDPSAHTCACALLSAFCWLLSSSRQCKIVARCGPAASTAALVRALGSAPLVPWHSTCSPWPAMPPRHGSTEGHLPPVPEQGEQNGPGSPASPSGSEQAPPSARSLEELPNSPFSQPREAASSGASQSSSPQSLTPPPPHLSIRHVRHAALLEGEGASRAPAGVGATVVCGTPRASPPPIICRRPSH